MRRAPLRYYVVAGLFCLASGFFIGLLRLTGAAAWVACAGSAVLAEAVTRLVWWRRRVKVLLPFVEDGHGNAWVRCGPRCDMRVVGPGKVRCSCAQKWWHRC